MIQWLKDLLKSAAVNGVHLPFAFDAETGKPSMTIFFPYLSFVMACASITAMHFREGLALATWTTIAFFVVCVVLYRMRKLDKAKFDLDDKSFELSANSEEEKPAPPAVQTPKDE